MSDETGFTEAKEEDFPVMSLSEDMQYFLYEGAKWARFIAVFGFIVAFILGLTAVSSSAIYSELVKVSPGAGQIPGGAQGLGIQALIGALMAFVPSLFLLRFSLNMKQGINYSSSEQLLTGLSNLKSYFKFWGIIALVFIALYGLSILMAIVGG
jgi:hypothetical protein